MNKGHLINLEFLTEKRPIVCVCVYIYIYIHIYTHIHTHIGNLKKKKSQIFVLEFFSINVNSASFKIG